MINKIKEELNNHIGRSAVIKCDLGRNKTEEYNVIIKKIYNHVFTVKLDNEEVKSFSYSDIISKIIKIDY